MKNRPQSREIALIFLTYFFWDMNWEGFSREEDFLNPISILIDEGLGIFYTVISCYFACGVIKEDKRRFFGRMKYVFITLFISIPVFFYLMNDYHTKLFLFKDILITTLISILYIDLSFKAYLAKGEIGKVKSYGMMTFLLMHTVAFIVIIFFDLESKAGLSIMALMYLVVFYISSPVEKKKQKEVVINDEFKEVIDKLSNLMEEGLYINSEITLVTVAEQLGITSHQLSNLLNNYFGENFNNYINKFRIEKAKILLREERDKNILEIAFEVGFNSSSTFYKAFQKFEGIAPGKYRKELI